LRKSLFKKLVQKGRPKRDIIRNDLPLLLEFWTDIDDVLRDVVGKHILLFEEKIFINNSVFEIFNREQISKLSRGYLISS